MTNKRKKGFFRALSEFLKLNPGQTTPDIWQTEWQKVRKSLGLLDCQTIEEIEKFLWEHFR